MEDRAISLNAVKDILKMANIEEFDIVAYRNIMQLPPVKPQPKTGHWIPVSERLPEKNELYLVCFDDGEYDLVYFSNYAFSYSGVIAWMPLPEPYKSQESEEI